MVDGRRLLILAGSVLLTQGAVAAGGNDAFMLEARNDLGNIKSLQRGARNFVNYCAGCHSAQYVRYSRIAKDLGLTEEQVLENFMFGAGKLESTMQSAMPADDARRWFGAPPPDLSLTARSRGADWIYSYLKGFYEDPKATFGSNNVVLENAAMPHVLVELQGVQVAKYEETVDSEGNPHEEIVALELASPGSLTPEQYDEFVRDLVNFMDYIGEPVKLERRSLGIKVLAFLLLLFVLTFLLKKEYWKDVH